MARRQKRGENYEVTRTPDGRLLVVFDYEFASGDYWQMSTQDLPSSIDGPAAFGHETDVTQANVLTFGGDWTGTGSIYGTGDDERLVLGPGEYMEGPIVNVGAVTVRLADDEYQAALGPAVTIKYKDGASEAACDADSWNTYAAPFVSAGYVRPRLER